MTLSTPPRPQLSALQQTRRFFSQPYGLISQARKECGDVFTLRLLGMGHWTILCSPKDLAQLYAMDTTHLAPGEVRGRLLGTLVGRRLSMGMDGDAYKSRRSQLMPFFGKRKILRHTDVIRQITENTVRGWSKGQTLSLQAEFDRIALRLISRILFGDCEPAVAENLLRRADEFLSAMKSPFIQAGMPRLNWGPWSPWGRFSAARERLFASFRQVIDSRRGNATQQQSDDIMAALIQRPLADDPVEHREIIVEELTGFLIGGSETTAKALGWTFLGLSSQPRLLSRLRQEIVSKLGRAPIRSEDLERLPYLDAAIHEGLRWQPAAPLVGLRLAKEDIELSGYRIPAGHVLAQAFRETGRHDGFIRPEAFDPESHFLGRKVPLADWLPFGGGERMCIGMALAKLEMAVVLTTVLQCCDLELLSKTTEPQGTGIAFQPRGGLPVRVRNLMPGR